MFIYTVICRQQLHVFIIQSTALFFKFLFWKGYDGYYLPLNYIMDRHVVPWFFRSKHVKTSYQQVWKFIPSSSLHYGYQWLPWVWHTHPTTQKKSKRDYDLANLLGNFKYDSSGRVANWGMFPCHACWRAMWSSCWSCIQHHRTIGFHNWGYDMVWTNQFFLISEADWLWL